MLTEAIKISDEALSFSLEETSVPKTASIKNETSSVSDMSCFPVSQPTPKRRTKYEKPKQYLKLVSQNETPLNVNEQKHIDKKSAVDGTVIKVEEYHAICELNLEGGNIEIQLPKNLFPDNPICGMSITLSVDEKSGIRQPIVKLRKPNFISKSVGNDKLSALINKL